MKKTKVLECIRQGLIGGGESHLLVLMEHLDKEKYDPVVLSFTDGPMINRLNELKIRNFIIHTTTAFDVRVWKPVKRLMQQEKIELVHVHGSRANSNVLWAAGSLKIPVIYTIHGWSFHPDQKPWVQKIRIWGEKYLTNKTSRNIAVSESNKQTGQHYIKGFDAIVVNNGIDQGRFNPAGRFKDIRAELGIAQDAIVVLFLARFTSHKQPLKLIEAFAGIAAENEQLHLLMVGDGDQKETALTLINKEGLKNRVTLLPFRLDVPDIIAAADIYVLPSLWEGLPIGLLEAMAMGKAVIGSRVDGTREVIEDQENGLLIEPGNLVNELKEKIVRLARDPVLREKLQVNAIRTINEQYNAANMTRQIETIYEQTLKNKLT